ncbi:glycoside hydrolase family 32 protein [Arthrobacter sp. B0490]|uniref:glycoside hydrolase family 32 protein n=1 Tax=Arthrobacter sp. B0490 TaxID=2058891 RepID=UPI00215794A2|nr:glycoside hydrolase family 32 protein [Arthrobacter sp. B0490]
MPRPLFHLTPQRHWMNDPNGLVFHRGRWHAFFQYNPEGSDWGNMSWGHASSADLQHWEELPVALRYRPGEQVYSGSVVVSSPGENGQLVAYYTSAFADGRQAQSRAISDDGGLTWQRDVDNPVLDRGTNAFRDPKIIRFQDHDGGFRWIMLAVEADDRQVLFFSSTDLRSWEHLSTFGPIGATGVVWECPDLIPLAVDGRADDVRWVLLLSTNPIGEDADPEGSSMSFVIGQFDGTAFTAESSNLQRLDHGRDFYAGVSFDSAPDGAAVILAWMSNWRYAGNVPSSPWRGAMSLPRRLSLISVDGEPRLVQEPPTFVTERLASVTPTTLLGSPEPLGLILSGHSLVDLSWDPATTGRLRLHLQGDADAVVELVHDIEPQLLRVTRSGVAVDAVHPDFSSTNAVPLAADGKARLLLSLDGPLLEVFVNGGRATNSNLVMLGSGSVSLTLETEQESPVTMSAVDLPSPAKIASPMTNKPLPAFV